MINRVLASDDEIDVAGPVLEQSQQLNNEILIAAAQTKSHIARRSSLAEVVTDVLVESGDKAVVLSTASNAAARFSNRGYVTLVKRSTGRSGAGSGPAGCRAGHGQGDRHVVADDQVYPADACGCARHFPRRTRRV